MSATKGLFGIRRLRKAFGASLSLKLIGIFVGGSILLSMLIGGLSQFGFERQFFSTARPILNHYIGFLAEEVGVPPSVERAQQLTAKWPLTIRVFDPSNNTRWASDGLARLPNIKNENRSKRRSYREPVFWDNGTAFLRSEAGDAVVYYGLRFRPGGPPWIPLMFIGLVLSALVGFFLLTKRLFSPIKTIEAGLLKIGDGQLDHRIEINRRDELGSLANRVNQMAAQLEGMLQAKRDLLLAISHELKSPLARSRVTLALLQDSENREALLNDQLEMQRLIDEIIDAERSQGDFAEIHRASTDMAALIDRVIKSVEKSALVESSIEISGQVNVDRVQIERLIRNLLENAIRYNRPEIGSVSISCHLEADQMLLQVSDFGDGIEAKHIKRLTEAFYRADASRERKTGGLGLGLYLCQAVVDAHKGTLTIHSQLGQGTQVECCIPVKSEARY